MENKQFHRYTEQLMEKIEDFIDRYAAETEDDIDYELTGNVMLITLPNQHKIIINTQEPLSQIWMATHQQGYHFDFRDNGWYCTRSQQEIMQLLLLALKYQA